MTYKKYVAIHIGTDGEYYEFEDVPGPIITQIVDLLFHNGKRIGYNEDDDT